MEQLLPLAVADARPHIDSRMMFKCFENSLADKVCHQIISHLIDINGDGPMMFKQITVNTFTTSQAQTFIVKMDLYSLDQEEMESRQTRGYSWLIPLPRGIIFYDCLATCPLWVHQFHPGPSLQAADDIIYLPLAVCNSSIDPYASTTGLHIGNCISNLQIALLLCYHAALHTHLPHLRDSKIISSDNPRTTQESCDAHWIMLHPAAHDQKMHCGVNLDSS
jgi:hypothetical protein